MKSISMMIISTMDMVYNMSPSKAIGILVRTDIFERNVNDSSWKCKCGTQRVTYNAFQSHIISTRHQKWNRH